VTQEVERFRRPVDAGSFHQSGMVAHRWRRLLSLTATCAVLLLAACSRREPAEAGTPDGAAPVADAARPAVTKDAGWGSVRPQDGTPPTFAPTFYAVYWEVLQPTCGTVFCHATDAYFELYSPARAYETLVGVASSSASCESAALERVKPGRPEESLLFLKITNPPCGTRMPPPFGGAPVVAPRQIDQIRRWILRGAPRDGGPDDRRTWDASVASNGAAPSTDAALRDASASASDGAAGPAGRDASAPDGAP
jgi:hypothetical protein